MAEARGQPFRMAVEDVFDIRTRKGPVVTGRIETGSVRVGDWLFLRDSMGTRDLQVASIEKFRQARLKSANAGSDEVGIEIIGVQAKDVKRGTAILETGVALRKS
jgi:translation elongation factor EF-Tu-like GTPase